MENGERTTIHIRISNSKSKNQQQECGETMNVVVRKDEIFIAGKITDY